MRDKFQGSPANGAILERLMKANKVICKIGSLPNSLALISTQRNSCHRPTEKEFNIPTTQDELNEMMSNMRKSGFDKEAMMQVFKDRKAKLNQALEDYDKKRESQPNNSPCH